jgi:hypothetical protein
MEVGLQEATFCPWKKKENKRIHTLANLPFTTILFTISYNTDAYNKLHLEFKIAMFTLSTQYTHGLHNPLHRLKENRKKGISIYNYT